MRGDSKWACSGISRDAKVGCEEIGARSVSLGRSESSNQDDPHPIFLRHLEAYVRVLIDRNAALRSIRLIIDMKFISCNESHLRFNESLIFLLEGNEIFVTEGLEERKFKGSTIYVPALSKNS